MKLYSLQNIFEVPYWLLILCGSLISLHGSLGQSPPCGETIEDFCCRGGKTTVFNKNMSRISGQLNGPQKYCVTKGYSWGKGCKNVNNTSPDGKIVGRRMLPRMGRRMGGAGAFARLLSDIAATEDNHRLCLFGTEPWCSSSEPCGGRESSSDILAEPPADEDPTALERICRGFNNDWIGCRKQSFCKFSCANRICQSVANYNAEGLCSQHCFNPCSCKQTGCEYSVATGACIVSKSDPCPSARSIQTLEEDRNVLECDISKFNDSCLRRNVFYSLGGVICHSKTRNLKCEVEEIIHAVNLNGPSITDQYNVLYNNDSEHVEYQDSYNIREMGEADKVFSNNREKDVYKTYVYGGGKPDESQGKCLTYLFSVSQNGKYLLGLKVVDFWNNLKMQRRYNILLNDVLILPELDVLKYSGRQNGSADIFVNFEVTKDADFSYLYIQGFLPVKLFDNRFKLSLCPGTCIHKVPDTRFQLSAFSVVRLRSNVAKCTKVCNLITDHCECRRGGCQWDSSRNHCIEELSSCGLSYLGEARDCVRAGAYYVSAGTWCRMPSEGGNCTNLETAFGINFNGLNYTDSRGIKYFAEKQIEDSITDNLGDRVGSTTAGYCNSVEGVTEEDSKYLYSTVIHGKTRKRSGKTSEDLRKTCVGLDYPIPVCADGRYELSIKTVESYWAIPKIRSFNVRLAGLDSELLVEVDLAKLNKRCHATEFIIILEVDDNQKLVRIQGHKEITLNKGEMEIKFCQGNCEGIDDQTYQISALSLVKIGELFSAGSDTCLQYSGDLCACKNNPPKGKICEHNSVTGDCVSFKEECTLCDIGPGECRHMYAFYAHGGILCQNKLQGGNCRVRDPIIALTLGPIVLSGRAALSPLKNKDCVQYEVPIAKDGWYETQISLGDFRLHDERKRTFTLILNEVYIVEEMDIERYSAIVSTSVKLNINFKVTENKTLLQITGYPDSPIATSRIVPLTFCLGDCKPDVENDYVWQLNSFKVFKILEKGDPGYDNATNYNELRSG